MKPIKTLTKNQREKILKLVKELEMLKLGYIQIIDKGEVIALMNENNYWNVIVDHGSSFIDYYKLKEGNFKFIENTTS